MSKIEIKNLQELKQQKKELKLEARRASRLKIPGESDNSIKEDTPPSSPSSSE